MGARGTGRDLWGWDSVPWGEAPSLPALKERFEDTLLKGLPQKYFSAFAVPYKCDPLSFCCGILPIRGF